MFAQSWRFGSDVRTNEGRKICNVLVEMYNLSIVHAQFGIEQRNECLEMYNKLERSRILARLLPERPRRQVQKMKPGRKDRSNKDIVKNSALNRSHSTRRVRSGKEGNVEGNVRASYQRSELDHMKRRDLQNLCKRLLANPCNDTSANIIERILEKNS